MISKQWRERLTYAAMSVFVSWHTLAMAVVPASEESELAKSLRGLLQPYIGLFNLDNHWDFFAPSIAGSSVFRYVVKDSNGVGHTFMPQSKWSWFSPSYPAFYGWYGEMLADPDRYADSFGRILCREHAELKPVSIVLQALEEQPFKPEDFLNGKHPLDPEFIKVRPVENVKCPAQ